MRTFVCSLFLLATLYGCVEPQPRARDLKRVSVDASVGHIPNLRNLVAQIAKSLGPDETEYAKISVKAGTDRKAMLGQKPDKQSTKAIIRSYDKQQKIADVEILNPSEFSIRIFQRWLYNGRTWQNDEEPPQRDEVPINVRPTLRRGYKRADLAKQFEQLSKQVDALADEARKGVTDPTPEPAGPPAPPLKPAKKLATHNR